MNKFFTAMLAVFALSFALASPAQAQLFRGALADSVYEQNVPGFRNARLMPSTGWEVDLERWAQAAFDIASGDGSLATLPEEFRTADAYKLRFRIVNGLTARTMPLEDFRALVNGQGIRLLRPSDFEAAAPAPIATPAPAAAAEPAPAPAVVTAPTVDYRPQIRRLENQLTQLQARPQVSLSDTERQQLASLPGVLEQLRTAQAAATASQTAAATSATNANASEIAAAGSAGNAAASQRAAAASAEQVSSAMSFLWLAIGLALVLGAFGFVAYGRTVRLGGRVETLENDSRDATVNRQGVHIPDELEEYLNNLNVGESYEFPITIDGEKLLVRFTVSQKGALKRTMVTTDDIDRQTQPMRVDTLRSKLLGHIGAGRLSVTSVQQKQPTLKAAA